MATRARKVVSAVRSITRPQMAGIGKSARAVGHGRGKRGSAARKRLASDIRRKRKDKKYGLRAAMRADVRYARKVS